jgi:ABC-type dipeptide/oligopeptide/nickel transport system ATPase component
MKDGEVVEEGKSYEIIKQAKTDYTRNLLASIPGSNYMQELIQ